MPERRSSLDRYITPRVFCANTEPFFPASLSASDGLLFVALYTPAEGLCDTEIVLGLGPLPIRRAAVQLYRSGRVLHDTQAKIVHYG